MKAIITAVLESGEVLEVQEPRDEIAEHIHSMFELGATLKELQQAVLWARIMIMRNPEYFVPKYED
jgi:hypothetical protein